MKDVSSGKPLRILEVIPALNSGGAERFVVDLCNQMARDECEVTLLTMKNFSLRNFGFYKDDIASGVKVVNLGLGKFAPTTFYWLYRAIRQQKCDVVHFHLTAMYFGVLAVLFDRKKKYIVTSHNQAESERTNERFRYWVKKLCLKMRLLRQVAISDQNAQSVRTVFGMPPVRLIYNGREMVSASHKFNEVKREVSRCKQDDDTKVFTVIARCNPQKNIPRLIRCFNRLIDDGENVALLVIGNGYDAPEMQSVISQAKGGIHFLGQRHNVADYLLCSDFFTLSSDYEGMPITLIEAFACGCIPVGTPVSGFNDVVTDGANGFIAKDFSDEAYTEALKRALAHGNSISKDSLRWTYAQNFSMETCAHKYEMLFREMVER